MGAAWLLAVGGCRDGVAPFVAEDRPAVGSDRAWPVTFGRSDEQSPVWAASGDSVYYSGEGRRTTPRSSWLLLSVPAEGGVAEPVRVDFYGVAGAAPAVTPQRDRIAYASMQSFSGALCVSDWMSCTGPERDRPFPQLVGLGFHVVSTAPGGDGGVQTLRVPVAGISQPDPTRANHYQVQYHPFQDYIIEDRAQLFRPSWSPDGTRIAYSDGLAIWIWRPGQEQPQRVPGTEDGIYPAWSPDGSRIAFTRVLRGPRKRSYCSYNEGSPEVHVTVCTAVFVVEHRRGTVLTTIRPDGTGRVELGAGVAPAWDPSGSTLFARRGDSVWRIAADGSGAAAVPETEGGHEPAVSPDGRRLAISRLNSHGDYDIWIVSLQP